MDEGGLGDCIANDPNLSSIPVDQNENTISILFDFMKSDDDTVNFADYVFLRKLNLSWKKCAIDN